MLCFRDVYGATLTVCMSGSCLRYFIVLCSSAKKEGLDKFSYRTIRGLS